MGGPLTIRKFSIAPAFEIVAASKTVPWMCAAMAIAGYRGAAPLSLRPSITPEEMTGFLDGVTRTCGDVAVPIESGRPLRTLLLPRGLMPVPISGGGS